MDVNEAIREKLRRLILREDTQPMNQPILNTASQPASSPLILNSKSQSQPQSNLPNEEWTAEDMRLHGPIAKGYTADDMRRLDIINHPAGMSDPYMQMNIDTGEYGKSVPTEAYLSMSPSGARQAEKENLVIHRDKKGLLR